VKAITSLNILIFPHIGIYEEPQGKEKDIAHVSLISTGNCVESARGRIIRDGHRLDFSADTLTQPVTVKCDQTATLERDSSVESFEYSGTFVVKTAESKSGKYLRVINQIALEDYVKGVMDAEMPAYWNAEALKSQAIAARTYGVFQTLNAQTTDPTRDYDMDDTVMYQAYTGITNEDSRANQAVDQTQGMVMTYQGGVIKAYFSQDSGGYSEDAAHVFGVVLPYCVGKKELFEYDQVPGNPWHVSLSYSQVTERLLADGLVDAGSTVVKLATTSDQIYESGRIRTLQVTLANGKVFNVDGQDFRLALGLKSTLFTWVDQNDGVFFTGRGDGHGVGMSQWGAKILGDVFNYTYTQILNFYYTDIVICDAKACRAK
jgi:stage II sporulation protein D